MQLSRLCGVTDKAAGAAHWSLGLFVSQTRYDNLNKEKKISTGDITERRLGLCTEAVRVTALGIHVGSVGTREKRHEKLT